MSTSHLILTGDVNLIGVDDSAVPFAQVAEEFNAADAVFSNLECCLYDEPPAPVRSHLRGYHAPAGPAGEALRHGGIRAVGLANNVNYGDEPILRSIERLDALGIAHTGAGADAAAAKAPIVVDAGGVRVGFLQRTAVYWPSQHEAGAATPGVAALRGNTAYQLPLHKTQPGMMACNRPGLPPVIVTWIDPPYLKALKEDVAALRARCDIVVMSCHWGRKEEVFGYMGEWAHAAIDAGADVVFGHGPHHVLPVEVYQGRPVFYGMGNFSFNLRPDGSKFGDWLGTYARLTIEGGRVTQAGLRFVRHNANNETVPRALADETAGFEELLQRSAAYGTRLTPRGDVVEIALG